MAIIFAVIKSQPAMGRQYTTMSTRQKLLHVDCLGGTLCLGGITSLLLALEWGGSTKPWNSATIIALFVVFAAALAAFVMVEWRQGWHALLPFNLFKRRTQLGASLEAVRGFPWFYLVLTLTGISIVFHRDGSFEWHGALSTRWGFSFQFDYNAFKFILVLSSVVVRANHHICARFGLKLTP